MVGTSNQSDPGIPIDITNCFSFQHDLLPPKVGRWVSPNELRAIFQDQSVHLPKGFLRSTSTEFSKTQIFFATWLVGGLVAIFYFPINIGNFSSSQLTFIFFRGVAWPSNHQADDDEYDWIILKRSTSLEPSYWPVVLLDNGSILGGPAQT